MRNVNRWLLGGVLLAMVWVALFTGQVRDTARAAPVDFCGDGGEHCGCVAPVCSMPCWDCCPTMPCPPDTCSPEHAP